MQTNARPKIVAVAGNIGAGKSSLVEWLEQQLGMVPFFEPHAENPYLAEFYGDMQRWGLHSQLFFLIHRFRIHKDIEARAESAGRNRPAMGVSSVSLPRSTSRSTATAVNILPTLAARKGVSARTGVLSTSE